jgi:hypothetical protein
MLMMGSDGRAHGFTDWLADCDAAIEPLGAAVADDRPCDDCTALQPGSGRRASWEVEGP